MPCTRSNASRLSRRTRSITKSRSMILNCSQARGKWRVLSQKYRRALNHWNSRAPRVAKHCRTFLVRHLPVNDLEVHPMHLNFSVAVSGTALVLVLSAQSVKAHHAFAAEFDVNKPVKINGTVTKVEFTNPHAWIYVDVKEPDGNVVNWRFELGAPNALIRLGLRVDT